MNWAMVNQRGAEGGWAVGHNPALASQSPLPMIESSQPSPQETA
jgi:hypothetical protein